jgi:hypothetical protein
MHRDDHGIEKRVAVSHLESEPCIFSCTGTGRGLDLKVMGTGTGRGLDLKVMGTGTGAFNDQDFSEATMLCRQGNAGLDLRSWRQVDECLGLSPPEPVDYFFPQ